MENNFKIKPVGEYLIIKPITENKTSESGLVITQTKKADTGTVMAVGDGIYIQNTNTFKPLGIEIGDTIMYDNMAGREFTFENEKYIILTYTNIIAIIK